MGQMDQYRDVFMAESADFLQQIVDGLLALETNPGDSAPVEVIFRGAHSLKGMAAAMGYERTADLTHKMEGLMDRVRKGDLQPGKRLVDLMLGAVDLVKDLIEDEAQGRFGIDTAQMVAALEDMTAGDADFGDEELGPVKDVSGSGHIEPASADTARWDVAVALEESCVLRAVRAYMVIKRLNHIGTVVDTVPTARDIEDENFGSSFRVIIETSASPETVAEAATQVTEVESAIATPWESADLGSTARADSEMATSSGNGGYDGPIRARAPRLSDTQTVRVSIGHLDTLVDLVGELVILRSRLERISDDRDDPELAETIDDLERISTDLQYEVMQTRMVPVGNIFNRFPRMVRDLAIELGKQVDFTMSGLEIELDRTVLDEIGDPLVHLLRNSIDHGVESPDERVAARKPASGTITLSATRERDHVAITVGDDGKGMDPDRLWAKACQRGLVDPSARADYSDGDILLFTCLPGFSTAEVATKVSGRGVGMDVVKGKIEHLGGTVEIKSTRGKGTDFVLRLPLTLAIVHALLVSSRGQLFAIPLSSVEEVMAVQDCQIDTVDGAPVVLMRDGGVIPMHRLDSLLFGADPQVAPEPDTSVVIMQTAGDTHALHVDRLVGRSEIVVKPLSNLLKDTRGLGGATILGDGRVVLILDPRSVFTAQEPHR